MEFSVITGKEGKTRRDTGKREGGGGGGRSRGMLHNRRKGEKRSGKEMGSVMSVTIIHAILSTNI